MTALGLSLGLPFVRRAAAGPSYTYATLDPATKYAGDTLSNGNLTVTRSSGIGWYNCRANMHKTAGKWYWEITSNCLENLVVGTFVNGYGGTLFPGQSTGGAGYYGSNGAKWLDGGSGGAAGATFSIADVLGLALDMDTGYIHYYKNGVAQGFTYIGANNADAHPALSLYAVGESITANFGATAFAYSVPSGYNAGVYE